MKRYFNNGEFLVSILLIAVGVVFAILTSGFGIDVKPDYPGPKLYPYIACFGLIVCGFGMLVQSIIKIHKTGGERFLKREQWIKLGVVLGILIVYAGLLATIGFFIATPLACFALVTYFAREEQTRLVQRILYALVFTGILYLVYNVLFGMKMPSGMLF